MVFKELCREPIDMKAMRLVIKQQVIGLERMVEVNPGSYVRSSALQGKQRNLENATRYRRRSF
jgi:hypothetical protein